jgi:general secretion pathway protein J
MTQRGTEMTSRERACTGPDAGGFTLLEIIIAFTIFSLVALMIGGALRLGMDAWDKGEAETGETQRLRVLAGLMSQQVRSAYPYAVDVDDEKVVLFKGEKDSILFATTFTDESFGGLKWVRYSFKDGTLFYKEGILPDKEFIEKLKKDEEVLDEDIGEVEFSFLMNKDEEWQDSWEFDKNLPSAVTVRISYFQPFRIQLPLANKRAAPEPVPGAVS